MLKIYASWGAVRITQKLCQNIFHISAQLVSYDSTDSKSLLPVSKPDIILGYLTDLLICTENGANRGSYLHSALTRPCRESLFYNQLFTGVLVEHFSVQMVGQYWMQIYTHSGSTNSLPAPVQI